MEIRSESQSKRNVEGYLAETWKKELSSQQVTTQNNFQ